MGCARRHVWPLGLLTSGSGAAAALAAVPVGFPGWSRHPAYPVFGGPQVRLHWALLAVCLLLLARGLFRRRRVAHWTAVVAAAAGAAVLVPAVLGLVLVAAGIWLALCHAEFPAVPAPGRIRTAVLGGLVVVGLGGGYDAVLRAHTEYRLDLESLLLLAAGVMLVVLLAAHPAPPPADRATRERVRALVAHPAADTLAPFALRQDKAYVFSRDGRAVLGYRVLLGIAVVGGDPVGEPESFPDVIAKFVRLCARTGWRPAVLGGRTELVPLWQAHGLRSIGIGDEALLEVDGFSLASRRMRNVRQAVRRTHNFGVATSVEREGDLTPALRAELAGVSDGWLRHGRERGFSMILDGLLSGAHPDCVVVIARDRSGRVVGFQRYALCAAGTALSLDTMRRDRRGPNGLNERMIVDVVAYARSRGVHRISLNFAAFRELVDEGGQRGPLRRAAHRAVHLLDPYIQVESLNLFNAKFQPGYLPRCVMFPSWSSLPTVAAAMLGMEFALGYDRGRVPEAAPAAAGEREFGHDALTA